MFLIKKLVPKEFRPFLNHIGPSAFKVIDWKEAITKISSITTRYMTGNEKSESRKIIVDHLPSNIKFSKIQKENITVKSNIKFGESILRLYFSQLINSKTIILDLRQSRFSGDSDNFYWNPSNLYCEFSPEFSEGLTDVYKGFYGDNSSLTDKGLIRMGLVQKDSDSSKRDKIKSMLLDHVGSENPEKTRFKLEKFERSFESFFQFLLEEKMRLPSDFLFLGIYLTTLYSCLEKVDSDLNVKESFLSVLKDQ